MLSITESRTIFSASDNLTTEQIENTHHGWLIIVNKNEEILYASDDSADISTFFRSAAKPFQAIPLVQKGLHHQLTEKELATICSSHSGSKHHREVVQKILEKSESTQHDLQCGSHEPTDKDSLKALYKTNSTPNALHHNCSGKHAGMLFYCQKAGGDKAAYRNPESPLQKSILKQLKDLSHLDTIALATDGCGLPVYYMPLAKMAFLYAKLSSQHSLEPIRASMLKFPEYVGGEGRIDTAIMQVSQGKLLAKVGADGVFCVARAGRDEGMALKISSGNNTIRNLVILKALLKKGWLEKETEQHPLLKPFLSQQTRTNNQNKPIGQVFVNLPD